MATATSNSNRLQAQRDLLEQEIKELIFGEDGYRKAAADEKDNVLSAIAMQLEAKYKELGQVYADLGEETRARAARRRSEIFELENNPTKLEAELKSAIANMKGLFDPLIVSLKDVHQPSDDPEVQAQYVNTINLLRQQAAYYQHLFDLGRRFQEPLSEAEAAASHLAQIEGTIELKARDIGAPYELADATTRLPTWDVDEVEARLRTSPASAAQSRQAGQTATADTASGPNEPPEDSNINRRIPHRRTGLPAVDRAICLEPEMLNMIHGQLPHGTVARGEFMIRKSKGDRFYLSPTEECDAQEIEVTIDPDDPKSSAIKDFLTKNQGWIVDAALIKKRDANLNPIFVLTHAEPWRDAEGKVKTSVNDPKNRGMPVSKSMSYDKYTYMALNARYRQLADVLVQDTRKELLTLDKEKTKRLLQVAGTLEAFKRNIRTSNLENDYINAIQTIINSKSENLRRERAAQRRSNNQQDDESDQQVQWMQEEQQAWQARLDNWVSQDPQRRPENFAEMNPAHAAVLKEILDERTHKPRTAEELQQGVEPEHKTYAEIIKGELPQPITYPDPTTGERKTVNNLSQNLTLADDQQMPPAAYAALKEDPKNLLAWAANRAVMRSVSHHTAAVSSRFSNETGERLPVTTDRKEKDFKKKSTDYITRENQTLVRRGILFPPRNEKDAIVPGLKPDEATAHATEFFGIDADARFSKDAIRMGATLLNTDYIDDEISKKLNQSVSEGAASSVEAALEAIDRRKAHVLENELPATDHNLIAAINDIRQENGLPEIGRRPVEDWKATVSSLEVVAGSVLKEMFSLWGEMEKPVGLF